MMGSGQGRRIVGGGLDATLKVAAADGAYASTFGMVIPPNYDVGAHSHVSGEEMFYVVDGELDVLAFEPVDRAVPDWHKWLSESGQTFLRGGPGAFLYVPPGMPHAFGNSSSKPATIFFQSSAPGAMRTTSTS